MKTRLLMTSLFLGLTAAGPAAVLREGHTDVGIAYENNTFNLHIHDESHDVEYAPGLALLLVKYAARETIPADPAYDFLRPAGQTHTWRLPQVQNPALLFLGIGAEEIEPGTFNGDNFTLKLSAVAGPIGGQFAVYETDAFNTPSVLFNSGDGITTADSKVFSAGTHTHVNWAFSLPGLYKVTFQVTAKIGTKTKTGTATYRFQVQSEADTLAPTVATLLDGIALETSGVQLTGLSSADYAPDGTLVTRASFRGEEVTKLDDSALLAINPEGSATTLVREGDEPLNAPGTTITSLNYPVVDPQGNVVFTAQLRTNTETVTPANDAVLAIKNAAGLQVIAREGEAAPGLPEGFNFSSFGTALLADHGVIFFSASTRNLTTPKPTSRSGFWRRNPNGSIELLAAVGTVLTTEVGPKVVRSFGGLNGGSTPHQDRAFTRDGRFSLLVSFTDGAVALLRFAAPPIAD